MFRLVIMGLERLSLAFRLPVALSDRLGRIRRTNLKYGIEKRNPNRCAILSIYHKTSCA